MRRDILSAAAVKMTAMAASYGAQLALIWAMLPADFGRFALLMALATLGVLPVTLGYPQLVLRGLAAGQRDRVADLWRVAHRWCIAATGCLLALGLGPAWIGAWVSLTELLCLAMILLSWGVLRLHAARLHGGGRTTAAQLLETVPRPMLCLLAVVALAGWIDIDTEVALALTAGAFSLALAATKLWGQLLVPLPATGQVARSRGWLSSALALSLISAGQVVMLNADLLMLGAFVAPTELAAYRVAMLLALAVAGIGEVVNIVCRPRIAASHAAGTLPALIERLRRLALGAGLLGTLIWAGIAIWGEAAMAAAFGEVYRAAALPAAILIAGQVAAMTLGPVALILNMTGQEQTHLRLTGVMLLANLGLNAGLIPTLGPTGAAIATALTLIGWRLGAIVLVERCLGLSYVAWLPGRARA